MNWSPKGRCRYPHHFRMNIRVPMNENLVAPLDLSYFPFLRPSHGAHRIGFARVALGKNPGRVL